MEATIVYWGYIGIKEKKMETTRMGLYRVLGLRLRLKIAHFLYSMVFGLIKAFYYESLEP